MLLYYIRHGEPEYDAEDKLTPLGFRQAEAVARRLTQFGVDEIYASSAPRAQLTARPTCDILRMGFTEVDWANEKHAWKDFAGVGEDGKYHWYFMEPRMRRLFTSPEMLRMGEEWYKHPALAETNCAEGIARVKRVTRSFLASLGYEYDEEKNYYRCVAPSDKRVALFAHAGFGLAFLSVVLSVPYPLFSTHFDMTHSGVTVIEFRDEGGWSIPDALEVSNDSHIYADRLPTRYCARISF